LKDEAKKVKNTRGNHKRMVVVPYVKGLSEAFARILKSLMPGPGSHRLQITRVDHIILCRRSDTGALDNAGSDGLQR